MRGILITFAAILMLIISSIYFGGIDFKKTTTDILIDFFDQMMVVTPETKSMILDSDGDEIKAYESYINTRFSSIATEPMIKDLYINGYVMQFVNYAAESNSNINFDSIDMIRSEDSPGEEYYGFQGTINVTSLDTMEEVVYSFSGEIIIVSDADTLKVDSFTLFKNELVKYDI